MGSDMLPIFLVLTQSMNESHPVTGWVTWIGSIVTLILMGQLWGFRDKAVADDLKDLARRRRRVAYTNRQYSFPTDTDDLAYIPKFYLAVPTEDITAAETVSELDPYDGVIRQKLVLGTGRVIVHRRNVPDSVDSYTDSQNGNTDRLNTFYSRDLPNVNGIHEADNNIPFECRVYNIFFRVFKREGSNDGKDIPTKTTKNRPTLLIMKDPWGDFYIVNSNQEFECCRALAKGAFTSSDSTITVDNVTVRRGISPLETPSSTSEELEVHNDFGWDGADNDVMDIEYDYTNEWWYIKQKVC